MKTFAVCLALALASGIVTVLCADWDDEQRVSISVLAGEIFTFALKNNQAITYLLHREDDGYTYLSCNICSNLPESKFKQGQTVNVVHSVKTVKQDGTVSNLKVIVKIKT